MGKVGLLSSRHIRRRLHCRSGLETQNIYCGNKRSRPEAKTEEDSWNSNNERGEGEICHRAITECTRKLNTEVEGGRITSALLKLLRPHVLFFK